MSTLLQRLTEADRHDVGTSVGRPHLTAAQLPGPLSRQPLIRTGRLTLRRVRMEDAPDIAAALGNHRVARMLARVPQPFHLEDATDWLGAIEASPRQSWLFAITLGGFRALNAGAASAGASDRLVGVIEIDWRDGVAEQGWHIGYWLDEPHWGEGIMTEALNAVVARFFSVMLGATIHSGVFADNPASLKVQEKLGFAVTGVEDVYAQSRAEQVRLITTELTFGGYMPM